MKQYEIQVDGTHQMNLPNKGLSLFVEGSDLLDHFGLVHILNVLFLHFDVVVVLEVGVDEVLVDIADQSNVKVHFGVPFRKSLDRVGAEIDVGVAHDGVVLAHVHLVPLELPGVGFLDHGWQVILGQDFIFVFPFHVALDFGSDLLLENGSELGHGGLVLAGILFDQSFDFLNMDLFEVVFREHSVGSVDFVGFEVLDVLDQSRNEGRHREVHQHVLVDVLHAGVAVVGELFDQSVQEVVLVPEENQVLPQVVDVREGPLLHQLFEHALLFVLLRLRLVGTDRLGQSEAVVEILEPRYFIAVLRGQVLVHGVVRAFEFFEHFLEGRPFAHAVGQHLEGDVFPFLVEGLRVVEFGLSRVELLDFAEKLLFGFDMLEELPASEHFEEDEPGTPDVALFVIGLEVDDLGRGVEGRAGTFGHLDFDISGEAEVGDFEFLVLVEEHVVGLEVPVHLAHFVDVAHGFEQLPEEREDLELTHFDLDQVLERAAVAELDEAVEPLRVLLAPVVPHDVGVVQLRQVVHHHDLPLVVGELLQHALVHELYRDDLVLRHPVPLVHHPEVSFAQYFRLIHVKVLRYLFHAVHLDSQLNDAQINLILYNQSTWSRLQHQHNTKQNSTNSSLLVFIITSRLKIPSQLLVHGQFVNLNQGAASGRSIKIGDELLCGLSTGENSFAALFLHLDLP